MIKTTLTLTCLLCTPAFALTALTESSMAEVVAKGGISIDTTSLANDGKLLSTGKISFSEFDQNSNGQDGFSVDGIKLYATNVDSNGNIIGASTITTDIDLGDDGSLFIKTKGLQRIDLDIGAISLGRRTLLGGISLKNARFLGNSYSAMKVSNSIEGTKFSFITQLGNGSHLTQVIKEDDVLFSSSVILNAPNSDPNAGFYSELFLLARGDDLRLEFGRIKGSVLMHNIVMTDLQGNNLFGGANFGSIGLSDLNIQNGHLTLNTQAHGGSGISGKFLLQAELGTAFIENDGGRINLSDIKLDMDSEIGYQMEFVDNAQISGIKMTFTPVNSNADTDIDISLGGIRLSDKNGINPSNSMGSFAIKNLNLKNSKLHVSILADHTFGNEGIRTDLALEGLTQFDLVIKDDTNVVNAPELSAKVSLNELKLSQNVDMTPQEIYIRTNEMKMSMNVAAIKIGTGLSQRGEMGKITINEFKILPNSYTLIKPI